eukprot:TRINITY_DN1263_c0_g1_i10.p1 TRINITY_DN1263_c0_g1~~TRINITY_DN1263_c0_g1_i10.p1  ORF type:complete len:215 (-),score=66.64 TRINITY_DN1263_c0_g1_i10:659-1303(-)
MSDRDREREEDFERIMNGRPLNAEELAQLQRQTGRTEFTLAEIRAFRGTYYIDRDNISADIDYHVEADQMDEADDLEFDDEYEEYVRFRDDPSWEVDNAYNNNNMRQADLVEYAVQHEEFGDAPQNRGYFPPSPPNSDEENDNDDNDELLLHNRRPYTGPGLLDEEDEAAMEEEDRLAEGAAEALAQEQAEQDSAMVPEARPELIFEGKKYIRR